MVDDLGGGDGLRNLATGEVRGQVDPLAIYGPDEVWATELDRLMGFPASGDLVVNGPLITTPI